MVKSKKTLYLLQIFRGIASLLVLLYHINGNVSTIFPGKFFFSGIFFFGYTGVDFFFVLSGFIIFYSSKRILEKKKYITFIKHRLTRIYPVYWIIAGGILFFQLILPSFFREHFDFTFTNIISTFFLFPEHIMLNGVSWSLSYELYFYFIFIFIFIFSFSWLNAPYYIIGVYCSAIIFITIMMPTNHKFVFSPLILDFFLGLIVLPISKFAFVQHKGKWILLIGCTFFFTAIMLVYNNYVVVESEIKRVIFYGLPCFLIVLGAFKYETENDIKPIKLFVILGDMSYSLYLIHLPIVVSFLKIISILSISNEILINFCCIVCIFFILSIVFLFHKAVEKPIMNAFKNPKKYSYTNK